MKKKGDSEPARSVHWTRWFKAARFIQLGLVAIAFAMAVMYFMFLFRPSHNLNNHGRPLIEICLNQQEACDRIKNNDKSPCIETEIQHLSTVKSFGGQSTKRFVNGTKAFQAREKLDAYLYAKTMTSAHITSILILAFTSALVVFLVADTISFFKLSVWHKEIDDKKNPQEAWRGDEGKRYTRWYIARKVLGTVIVSFSFLTALWSYHSLGIIGDPVIFLWRVAECDTLEGSVSSLSSLKIGSNTPLFNVVTVLSLTQILLFGFITVGNFPFWVELMEPDKPSAHPNVPPRDIAERKNIQGGEATQDPTEREKEQRAVVGSRVRRKVDDNDNSDDDDDERDTQMLLRHHRQQQQQQKQVRRSRGGGR